MKTEQIVIAVLVICSAAVVQAEKRVASASQYNMSLQDKVVTGPKGSLTSPKAASVNRQADGENIKIRF
ncbi:MAG: hypothetical protein ACYS76_04910 [Planctomycetota bacterium]|jgi:hypothetical protein